MNDSRPLVKWNYYRNELLGEEYYRLPWDLIIYKDTVRSHIKLHSGCPSRELITTSYDPRSQRSLFQDLGCQWFHLQMTIDLVMRSLKLYVK